MEYRINNIIEFKTEKGNKVGNIENIENDVLFIKGNDAREYQCKENDVIQIKGDTFKRKVFSDIQGKGYGRPELENSKEFEKWKQNGYK